MSPSQTLACRGSFDTTGLTCLQQSVEGVLLLSISCGMDNEWKETPISVGGRVADIEGTRSGNPT